MFKDGRTRKPKGKGNVLLVALVSSNCMVELACLLACLLPRLLAGLVAGWLVYLLVGLLACLLAALLVGSNACRIQHYETQFASQLFERHLIHNFC